ncbi:MAG: class B sortase [Clostridia bacterium]|nr:class B sortase [Clostridia bacterium]
MAENKKDYNPDFSENTYNYYPDFDSLEIEEVVETATVMEVAETEEKQAPAQKAPEQEEKRTKKSPLFAVLCAVLCVAIVACSALSVFSINNYLNSSKEEDVPVQSNNSGYNLYTTLVPKYKTTKYPTGIPQELIKAYSVNNDVVGWLYIPGTNVNTPIVQSDDNNYYLRYNFYGSNTNYGTAYADYRCKKNTLSANTVIYGHNMPSGTHFYDVHRYEDIEWYKQHPIITYTTLNGSYTFLVYTAFYSTGTVKYNGGYYFNYIYPNMGPVSMKGYIEQIDQRAIYTTAVDLKPTDRIITLSTCTHSLDSACGMDIDGRLVVVGRLLRAGENIDVDTSKAKSNPNYRRPQIWYDKKGKTNPYAKSVTWQPSQK